MWFLIRSAIGFVALLGAAYLTFFVDVGGKSLAVHASEVWKSPTVQSKVGLVREGVRNELEDRLAAAAERETRRAVRERLGEEERLADEDRDALNDIVAE